MTVEQWGVRVPVRQGEETRQALIGEGALDVTLKVLRDGTALVFPVLEERGGAGRFVFEEQPGRIGLPRHELVGGIAIMQENDPAGAALILASRPSLHTVLFPTSEVSGKYRIREYPSACRDAHDPDGSCRARAPVCCRSCRCLFLGAALDREAAHL